MIPSKPISRRSTPDTIGRLNVVGVFGEGSSAGISMCAVITAPAPAAMPARNGGNSVLSSISRGSLMIGSPRWESTSVSP